jgi:plastocyanin domain-containing protein
MNPKNAETEMSAKSCSCCVPSPADLKVTSAGAGSSDVGGGVQEARITVKGGYSPSTVRLAKGVPARLIFERHEASRCSEELLIPAFGVQQRLPQDEATIVEFTPGEAGTFAFTCGMRMLRGEISVS